MSTALKSSQSPVTWARGAKRFHINGRRGTRALKEAAQCNSEQSSAPDTGRSSMGEGAGPRSSGLVALTCSVILILLLVLLALSGQSWAQGLSGLSKLLGGNPGQTRNSSRSDTALTVERNATPYVGSFDGTQNDKSQSRLHAEFACYPAHDPALAQTRAFVCYTAQ